MLVCPFTAHITVSVRVVSRDSPYMVNYSLTEPLNFLIFVLAFDNDRIWSGMQMKMLINALSSL